MIISLDQKQYNPAFQKLESYTLVRISLSL